VPSLLSLSSLSLPLYPGEIFTYHYLAQQWAEYIGIWRKASGKHQGFST